MTGQSASGYRPGEWEAYQLQMEYVSWRRDHGLEPTAEQLNRFEQTWERLGVLLEGREEPVHVGHRPK